MHQPTGREPGRFRHIRHLALVNDYLLSRLAGKAAMPADWSSASVPTAIDATTIDDLIEEVRARAARRERVLSWKYRADGGRLEHFNAHFDEGGRLTGVSRTPDPESINAQ